MRLSSAWTKSRRGRWVHYAMPSYDEEDLPEAAPPTPPRFAAMATRTNVLRRPWVPGFRHSCGHVVKLTSAVAKYGAQCDRIWCSRCKYAERPEAFDLCDYASSS